MSPATGNDDWKAVFVHRQQILTAFSSDAAFAGALVTRLKNDLLALWTVASIRVPHLSLIPHDGTKKCGVDLLGQPRVFLR